MKKVLGTMSKFVGGIFSLAVLALLMSLTYGALQRIFPGNFTNQMWGLVMFDIAAMCWALMFVFQSKSTAQYASAGTGFLVGFVGTLGMVAAEVILSGQDLAKIDTGEIGKWMIYGFIVVTALHAALVYIHHGTAPEITEQINVGVARGEVVSQAIKDATHTIEAEKQELSRAIYYDIVSQVKRDLGLHPVTGTPFERKQLTAPIPQEVKAMYAPGTQFTDGTSNPLPVTWAKQEKPKSLWEAVKQGIRQAQQDLAGSRPAQKLAHPENIIWNRGDDPAAYYDPSSEYALPCGHAAGATWNPAIQAEECNACGARWDRSLPADRSEADKVIGNYNDPKWHASTDITPTLDAYNWTCEKCEGTNPAGTRNCQWCKNARTNGSPVTAFASLPPKPKPASNVFPMPPQEDTGEQPGPFPGPTDGAA
jgi:hypothetical protein